MRVSAIPSYTRNMAAATLSASRVSASLKKELAAAPARRVGAAARLPAHPAGCRCPAHSRRRVVAVRGECPSPLHCWCRCLRAVARHEQPMGVPAPPRWARARRPAAATHPPAKVLAHTRPAHSNAPPPAPPPRPPAAEADAKVFESHGKQIVVEANGTIIIGPGAGSNGAGLPAPRDTAEVEYMTGERPRLPPPTPARPPEPRGQPATAWQPAERLRAA